jgi:hypothetical protein
VSISQDQPTEVYTSRSQHRPVPPDTEFEWDLLAEDLPSYPPPAEASWQRLHKLVKELERRAFLMTAGRDLHDIHTLLYLVVTWDHLSEAARSYTAHRMRLL